MKKIGIMQPYIFPYIGYFQLMNAVDAYVIYDDVQFIKGGWINRNNILSNGQRILFTFPLSGASPNKLIREVGIQDDFDKFKRTLAMAYSKAPYKEAVLKLVDEVVGYPDKGNIAYFIGNSFRVIAQYIGITTEIIYSSDLGKDVTLKGSAKVIAICEEIGGTHYINAIGGQDLYDKESFRVHGIELAFLKTHEITYRQLKNEFVSNLSIIDVMMFNSPEEIKAMLNDYELL